MYNLKKKKIKLNLEYTYVTEKKKERVEKYEAILSKTTAKDSLVLCLADVTNICPLYFPYCVLYHRITFHITESCGNNKAKNT